MKRQQIEMVVDLLMKITGDVLNISVERVERGDLTNSPFNLLKTSIDLLESEVNKNNRVDRLQDMLDSFEFDGNPLRIN